uniref:Uncharacterized protein n=1 Tax=Arundo donax TaxID=35708 RepID=A0A0A9H423_ARUDO
MQVFFPSAPSTKNIFFIAESESLQLRQWGE